MNQPVNSFAVDKPAQVTPNSIENMNLSPEQQKMLKNLLDSFISGGQGREFDLSKPPVERYVHRNFPMMVYRHETGHVLQVNDPKQLDAATKKGFQREPSPNHDYSQVRNGIAAPKHEGEARPVTLSAEDLLEEEAGKESAGTEAQETASEETAQEAPASRRRR